MHIGDEVLMDSGDANWRDDDLRLPLSDRGLAYGHGVFESMLYSEGEVALVDFHLDRLITGAERLGICLLYTSPSPRD